MNFVTPGSHRREFRNKFKVYGSRSEFRCRRKDQRGLIVLVIDRRVGHSDLFAGTSFFRPLQALRLFGEIIFDNFPDQIRHAPTFFGSNTFELSKRAFLKSDPPMIYS